MGVKLFMLADEARRAGRSYAKELGIPAPIKTTAVAPTGSISMLPGVTAGIHPIYARHFKRRIRYADNDPAIERHLGAGRHVEPCQYTANTSVVTFVARDTILDHYAEHLIEQADEISVTDMLRTQSFVQENFADNAVSFTVNLSPETSRSETACALIAFLPELKGTTVMVDGSRPQAPFERIDRQTYEHLTDGTSEASQAMDDCSTGACPVR